MRTVVASVVASLFPLASALASPESEVTGHSALDLALAGLLSPGDPSLPPRCGMLLRSWK